jgi:hypothetical protein
VERAARSTTLRRPIELFRKHPRPIRFFCGLAVAGLLAACSFRPSSVPPNAIVAASVPASWKPVRGYPASAPTIVGARFSSLDVELGQDWDGDVVTSTDVVRLILHTNLFDIEATRSAPGRFHFFQHVIDDPAFIVRPYALEVTATSESGLITKLIVPFTLRGHGVTAS